MDPARYGPGMPPEIVPPAIVAEVARLLNEAGVTQYQLRQAGIGSATARNLLDAAGTFRADQLDKALKLIGRRLWHGKRPKDEG